MKIVCYYRVSTRRQSRSGLGLAAQRKIIRDFIVTKKDCELIQEFREVESGMKDDRPELEKALRLCRLTGAMLVVAKLDRFSRSAAYILTAVEKSGVRFVFCDCPEADETTIGVFAVVARRQWLLISERTREALAAAKARGIKLGTNNLPDYDTSHIARAARTATANARAEDLRDIVTEIREQGATSLRAIAGELNARRIPTSRNKQWQATSVRRLLTRLEQGA